MRSDLIRIDTSNMPREEWLKYQLLRTGGSSAGTLMGLNKWMSPIELFYLYLGLVPQKQTDNAPMFMGRLLEPHVAELWRYWGGTMESVMENYAAGTPVQEYEKIDAILVNPDIPNMHANIDGYIKRNREGRSGILEIKTISGYSADQYEAGIPISYIVQVHSYMLVCEEAYAEIAMLKDGRDLEVFPIERNESIIERIRSTTNAFWERVNEAKTILASDLSQEQKNSQVGMLEPDPDDSMKYEEFLKEKFKANAELAPIEGTQEHWELAMEHETVAVPALKQAEAHKQLCRNRLLRAFEDAEVMEFGEAGRITYKANARGVRSLRFNLKI